ncbi:MAG: hypothetical protein BWY76_02897 [bacterium ADurb.Bin429]|nr:MAG: hypothetical protein BWY76_02897 [bacterium ADurb.Bin429]
MLAHQFKSGWPAAGGDERVEGGRHAVLVGELDIVLHRGDGAGIAKVSAEEEFLVRGEIAEIVRRPEPTFKTGIAFFSQVFNGLVSQFPIAEAHGVVRAGEDGCLPDIFRDGEDGSSLRRLRRVYRRRCAQFRAPIQSFGGEGAGPFATAAGGDIQRLGGDIPFRPYAGEHFDIERGLRRSIRQVGHGDGGHSLIAGPIDDLVYLYLHGKGRKGFNIWLQRRQPVGDLRQVFSRDGAVLRRLRHIDEVVQLVLAIRIRSGGRFHRALA